MVDKSPAPKSNPPTLEPKIPGSNDVGPFEVKSPHALVAAMIGIFVIIAIIIILNWGKISQRFKKTNQDKSLDKTKEKNKELVKIGPDGKPVTTKS